MIRYRTTANRSAPLSDVSSSTNAAKSLAINPATTTHSQMNEEEQRLCGITPGMVRLSIGIETIDDIIADIEQALA